jgi:hypothetical protein
LFKLVARFIPSHRNQAFTEISTHIKVNCVKYHDIWTVSEMS